ncbi:cytochrome c oxidase assembly protein [Nocardia aurea]|uniref:cytochrome c oxidase assembly protein n=1 Tax=Nocardia aurea TaxID=2144174 RepID=UPI001300A854|nr:cytochrome c oxidase assembly protein [Nocardia aurea]
MSGLASSVVLAHAQAGNATGADWYTIVGMAAVVSMAVLYASAAARSTRTGDYWPLWRSFVFGCGLLVAASALFGGVRGSHPDLAGHIGRHLLLMMAVPPLLLAGQPVQLLLLALPTRRAAALREILQDPAVRSVTVGPLVRLLLVVDYYGSMVVFMHTPLLAWATTYRAVHLVTGAYFLVCGFLFWSMILSAGPPESALPTRAAIAMLLVGVPVNLLLGLSLLRGVPGVHGAGLPEAAWLTAVGGGTLSIIGAVLIVARSYRHRTEEDRWLVAS